MGETIQASVTQAGGGFDPSFLIMLAAMFAVMYFLMIRPQRKQQQEHAALLASLKKGDEVVLSSGLIGKIFSVESRLITLDLGNNTRVRVVKQSVSGRASALLGNGEKEKAATEEAGSA
ncbi:MAG: preprotein translocase subunit YajC [Myxococcota bacterium]